MTEAPQVPRDWFDRIAPCDLLHLAEQRMEAMSSERLCNAPDSKTIREAWVAARFTGRVAAGRPLRVRLVDDRFPDFEVRDGNQIHGFEIVEADKAGRRRGKEYRDLAEILARGEAPPIERIDPDRDAAAAMPAIVDCIRRKAGKSYATRINLLVFVNFWPPRELGHAVREVNAHIEPWRESFTAIWLLWGREVVRCWPRPARMLGAHPA
jgi:hypothetical protein